MKWKALLFCLLLVGLGVEYWLGCLPFQRTRYYGFVVDQDGQPIPGVRIKQGTYVSHGLMSGGHWSFAPAGVTDTTGKFSLKEYRDHALPVELECGGYDFESGQFYLNSDKDHPAKFVMRKRRGAGPMVKGRTDFPMFFDGQEVRFDLLEGRVVKGGGDLIFRLQAPPVAAGENRNASEWHLEVSVVDGGLQLIGQRDVHEAPKEGYVPQMTFGPEAHKETNEQAWPGDERAKFFATTRGKLYSTFHFSLSGNPAFGSATIYVSWQLNPEGSRNLEYDSAKDVTMQYRKEK